MSSTLNMPLIALLVVCNVILCALWQRRPIYLGRVVKRDIDVWGRGNTYITIETRAGDEVLLAFDTTAKIGCKHSWLFGRSQCFHEKGLALEILVKKGTYIKVRTERVTDGAQYVRKLFKN